MNPLRPTILAALLALPTLLPFPAYGRASARVAADPGGGPAPAAGASLRGPFKVEVNDHGVLVAIPPAGLRTVDGPLVELGEGFAEWFGIRFQDAAGQWVEGVGTGSAPDWAGRASVTPAGRNGGSREASFVTRLGEMEIVTRFEFGDGAPLLLAQVLFTNRGGGILRNIFYTREWRQPGVEGWTFPPDLAPALAPGDPTVCRRAWMLDEIPPGETIGLRFSYEPDEAHPPAPAGLDVPLSLWTSPTWPSGVPVGGTNGLSFGDYDADGFIDMFAASSGNLWRNLGGVDWTLAANLSSLMQPSGLRYGSSFGDYNHDGLPDIATEPRNGSDRLHLLKNLGGGPSFLNVAGDPAIVDLRPFGDAETICWADVDGDTDMDMFVPVYPPWIGSPGNFFLQNLGPTGPGGQHRFHESSAASGLDNPPGSARPEGAQFCDVDFDGDLDLYSNGTLYQNRSTTGAPDFDNMTSAASGIGLSGSLDEGAVFFDYDMDGDFDLFVVYTNEGVRIWESYGDGNFFQPEGGLIDSPFTGLDLGMSAEDWDNDGDVDFTTRQVFRRNQWMEGQRHFTQASHAIPGGHITSATPSWGDWDHDGDLDCALGNWLSSGHFYHNTLYDAGTPAEDRRHLRIKVLRDSEAVPAGLEAEYGARVEIHPLGGPPGNRRVKFVASGHGYLNQNEYTLHFAMPADPVPGDPGDDVNFDVTVDFPTLPSEGLLRVDKYVNPALGNVDLAELADREIRVFRSGKVLKGGVTYDPPAGFSPTVLATAGGLALPTPSAALPAPSAAPGGNWNVGLAFNTHAATGPLRVKEILLDGRLAGPALCPPQPFNIALWDVTTPGSPVLVPASRMNAQSSSRNRRTSLRADVVLEPGREYRLVARVTELRATPVAAPLMTGPVELLGGLSFQNNTPCSGAMVEAAAVLPSQMFVAFRFSPDIGAATEVALDGPAGGAELAAAARPVIGQPRPNPFVAGAAGPGAPRAEVPYFIAREGEIRLEVFDVAGRRVRALEGGRSEAGWHRAWWDGHDDDGRRAPAGIYLYRLTVDGVAAGVAKAVLAR